MENRRRRRCCSCCFQQARTVRHLRADSPAIEFIPSGFFGVPSWQVRTVRPQEADSPSSVCSVSRTAAESSVFGICTSDCPGSKCGLSGVQIFCTSDCPASECGLSAGHFSAHVQNLFSESVFAVLNTGLSDLEPGLSEVHFSSAYSATLSYCCPSLVCRRTVRPKSPDCPSLCCL